MFEHITQAPDDPILGLAELFRTDPRQNKINLGIGVYKDEMGQTPVLNSVKQAERALLENEISKNYLSIDGMTTFATHSQILLLGKNSTILNAKRAHTAQTPGGTAALRVAADFIARHTSTKQVWISNPSWPNHRNIFQTAGLNVREYRYYDEHSHALDFEGMIDSLQEAKPGDVVVWHGCCHNPTGIDPTESQWQQLADLSAARGWLPLFDCAYQGFAFGLEEDTKGLRLFADSHQELIIASSYSKNFGLYNERVGACTLITGDSQTTERAFSQIKAIIRANYSNPPFHGAAIVTTILDDSNLRHSWEQELTAMRQRIHTMRQLFVDTLQQKGAKKDLSFITRQNGMFSFSGLNKDQVIRLRDEFAVYALLSGRISVAGMTEQNMDPLCSAIVAVL